MWIYRCIFWLRAVWLRWPLEFTCCGPNGFYYIPRSDSEAACLESNGSFCWTDGDSINVSGSVSFFRIEGIFYSFSSISYKGTSCGFWRHLDWDNQSQCWGKSLFLWKYLYQIMDSGLFPNIINIRWSHVEDECGSHQLS